MQKFFDLVSLREKCEICLWIFFSCFFDFLKNTLRPHAASFSTVIFLEKIHTIFFLATQNPLKIVSRWFLGKKIFFWISIFFSFMSRLLQVQQKSWFCAFPWKFIYLKICHFGQGLPHMPKIDFFFFLFQNGLKTILNNFDVKKNFWFFGKEKSIFQKVLNFKNQLF